MAQDAVITVEAAEATGKRVAGTGEIEERLSCDGSVRYRVRVRVDGRKRTVGTFTSLELAQAAADKACERRDRQRVRALAIAGSLEHGFTLPAPPRDIHGIWTQMLARCHDPSHIAWKHYGGRGIAVCPSWQHAMGARLFYAHIGPRPSRAHTVDRVDNDRGYEPGNVRWATPKQQAANKRRKSA